MKIPTEPLAAGSRNREGRNPILLPVREPSSKRAVWKGKKVEEVAEKSSEEELAAEEEKWFEVKKSSKRGQAKSVPLQKQARVVVAEPVVVDGPVPMNIDLEWPMLVRVGTQVMFKNLTKSAGLNSSPGAVVAVVDQDKCFLVSTNGGMTVSVLKEKLSIIEDDDILVVEKAPVSNSLVVKETEENVILTPRQMVSSKDEVVTPKGGLGGAAVVVGCSCGVGHWASRRLGC